MGEHYGRLKTNLLNLLFLRNIMKDNEALQNTSQKPRSCQFCFLCRIKPFSENLQHQELEGHSGGLPLLGTGCTGEGQW